MTYVQQITENFQRSNEKCLKVPKTVCSLVEIPVPSQAKLHKQWCLFDQVPLFYSTNSLNIAVVIVIVFVFVVVVVVAIFICSARGGHRL